MRIQILDEHQEAYASIDDLVQANRIGSPIALVHVDSHEDMEVPLGGWSCYELPARRYVERNLTSGDFILPLLLKGYVQKVIYVNFQDDACSPSNIGSLAGAGKFMRTHIADDHVPFYPDIKPWFYQKTSDIAALSDLVHGYNVILDIDCDYFAWHRIPRPIYPFRLSAAQMECIDRHSISDDDHRMKLRILPHQLPTINRLTFNDSRIWIKLLIDYFCFYLDLEPGWTLIARSAKSGFTPKKYSYLIEKRLIRRLMQPPVQLEIPLEERLEMSPFVIRRDSQWYSFSTNRLVAGDPWEGIIMQGIANEETIGTMRERLLRRCNDDECLADYRLLRTIFNLKKTFAIQ